MRTILVQVYYFQLPLNSRVLVTQILAAQTDSAEFKTPLRFAPAFPVTLERRHCADQNVYKIRIACRSKHVSTKSALIHVLDSVRSMPYAV